VDRLTQPGNFENLLEPNKTILAKEKLILMDFSTSVQIKNIYEGHKVFILRVQTELIN
jgi:hypothetical protein